MTITIDLPDEVYQRLERQARARGITTAEAVAQVMEEAKNEHIYFTPGGKDAAYS